MSTSIFSPEQLATLVTDTLPSVPDGRTNAVVGTVDQNGAQVVVMLKTTNDRWAVTGVARHDWAGDNEVGANVIYSW